MAGGQRKASIASLQVAVQIPGVVMIEFFLQFT
jgi:hypothetical protein